MLTTIILIQSITLILLLNSSKTSIGFTGLTPDDLLALGIAKGNSSFFNSFLIILFLGNLIPTVFKFAQARGLILELREAH